MRNVSLSNVDLNLLKTFMAIWEFGSLTQAADVLHLSQPAVSHALRRLREVFNDPLFVRNGAVMVPTDAAVRLHDPIDEALVIIRSALQQHARFDPATSTRVFKLAMSDMAELYVLPLLLEMLAEKAPSVRVQTRQMPVEDMNVAMRNGDIELAVGYLPGLGEDCIGMLMLRDGFVCLLRSGHPLASVDLNLASLRELGYVHGETNFTGHGLAEHQLTAAGIHRNIIVRTPHFTICPHIVAKTDLALLLPRAIARAFTDIGAFVIKEIPIEMPVILVKAYSHKRFQADSGISWLRSELVQLCGDRETVQYP